MTNKIRSINFQESYCVTKNENAKIICRKKEKKNQNLHYNLIQSIVNCYQGRNQTEKYKATKSQNLFKDYTKVADFIDEKDKFIKCKFNF